MNRYGVHTALVEGRAVAMTTLGRGPVRDGSRHPNPVIRRLQDKQAELAAKIREAHRNRDLFAKASNEAETEARHGWWQGGVPGERWIDKPLQQAADDWEQARKFAREAGHLRAELKDADEALDAYCVALRDVDAEAAE